MVSGRCSGASWMEPCRLRPSSSGRASRGTRSSSSSSPLSLPLTPPWPAAGGGPNESQQQPLSSSAVRPVAASRPATAIACGKTSSLMLSTARRRRRGRFSRQGSQHTYVSSRLVRLGGRKGGWPRAPRPPGSSRLPDTVSDCSAVSELRHATPAAVCAVGAPESMSRTRSCGKASTQPPSAKSSCGGTPNAFRPMLSTRRPLPVSSASSALAAATSAGSAGGPACSFTTSSRRRSTPRLRRSQERSEGSRMPGGSPSPNVQEMRVLPRSHSCRQQLVKATLQSQQGGSDLAVSAGAVAARAPAGGGSLRPRSDPAVSAAAVAAGAAGGGGGGRALARALALLSTHRSAWSSWRKPNTVSRHSGGRSSNESLRVAICEGLGGRGWRSESRGMSERRQQRAAEARGWPPRRCSQPPRGGAACPRWRHRCACSRITPRSRRAGLQGQRQPGAGP